MSVSTTSSSYDVYQITQRINERLGLSATLPGGEISAPDGVLWDAQIGSLPFLYAFSDQNPYVRETAEFRRERIDTATNPGEQSLDSGYWSRSAESWHYGGGLRSAEPLEIEATEFRFRYATGGGVDPWTAGELTLLKSTDLIHEDAEPFSLLGTTEGVLMYDAVGVKMLDDKGAEVWSNTDVVAYSLTTDGESWYAGTEGGDVYTGSLLDGAGSVSHSFATGPVLIRWVKGRLIATAGKAVYEGAGDTWTEIDPGTTFPDDWVWTDAAEGPEAIYMSGFSGVQSSIYKIEALVEQDAVTLAPLVSVADMPRGEIVYTLYTYVGAYLCTGTSKGVRITGIREGGNLLIGPVVRQVDGGVTDFVALGSFVYAAVSGDAHAGNRRKRPGLVRLNLGTRLNGVDLDFAHADDLVAEVDGVCSSVTVLDGRLVLGVEGSGVWRESDLFVDEGWLETGRIRLGTTEPKTWRDLRLLMRPESAGSVTAHVSREQDDDAPGAWQPVTTVTGERYDRTGKVSSNPNEPATSLYIAVRLNASDDKTLSPVLSSYQLRAIPSPARTRLIKVPLQLFDSEQDRGGNVMGYDGYAYDRLLLMEALEQQYALTPFFDYTTGERVNTYIERVSYIRTAPPRHTDGNNGGIMTLLLRVI